MDDLSCKQRCANVVAMEMLKNCKSAQTKAQYYGIQKTTSERSEWFHKNKFDIMMAWMTPVSLHFSDVPTGWKKNLYRQTTVGYWFCMFVTNSLSRRTVLQINLRQLHSVPCAIRYASLPSHKHLLFHFETENTTPEFDITNESVQRNFSSVFDVQGPFRAKGLRLTK